MFYRLLVVVDICTRLCGLVYIFYRYRLKKRTVRGGSTVCFLDGAVLEVRSLERYI